MPVDSSLNQSTKRRVEREYGMRKMVTLRTSTPVVLVTIPVYRGLKPMYSVH